MPIRSTALAVLFTLAGTVSIRAQNQPASTAKSAVIPVKVTVTISRYQGEKRISSLPYILSASLQPQTTPLPRGSANLRIGTKVPITAMTQDKGRTPVPTVTYQDVGTNIDCFVYGPDETSRFRLEITIDESSVYEDPATKVVQIGRPTLRSFRTSNSLLIKDGESAQMSNTPDRMTGEIVRVDVALAVIK